MTNDNNDSATINRLIKVTIDSADGYRKAADEAKNPAFQSIFFERANERDAIVDQLQNYVHSHGGDPIDDGSMAAGAHRLFLDLRDAVMGNDDKTIIAEVERGEDYIKEKYETARSETGISADARMLIDECYAPIKAGHDQMRDLKHGMDPDGAPMGSAL